ncbi:hypothetical protein RKD20_006316 [Streptomyces sp. SLBN-8D4]
MPSSDADRQGGTHAEDAVVGARHGRASPPPRGAGTPPTADHREGRTPETQRPGRSTVGEPDGAGHALLRRGPPGRDARRRRGGRGAPCPPLLRATGKGAHRRPGGRRHGGLGATPGTPPTRSRRGRYLPLLRATRKGAPETRQPGRSTAGEHGGAGMPPTPIHGKWRAAPSVSPTGRGRSSAAGRQGRAHAGDAVVVVRHGPGVVAAFARRGVILCAGCVGGDGPARGPSSAAAPAGS